MDWDNRTRKADERDRLLSISLFGPRECPLLGFEAYACFQLLSSPELFPECRVFLRPVFTCNPSMEYLTLLRETSPWLSDSSERTCCLRRLFSSELPGSLGQRGRAACFLLSAPLLWAASLRLVAAFCSFLYLISSLSKHAMAE